jgi:Na+/melibiose symporter-like transporter
MRASLWPPADERALLGRFYLAHVLTETLNVVFHFQFVYLYLVMERVEWVVLPLMVESAAVLLMEIPTGAAADRWGRKRSVIAGGLVTAAAWALVPVSMAQPGSAQLAGACAAYMLAGVGMTMVSGAREAWVVDNLAAARRLDLLDRYFARARSFAAMGGIAAGLLALAILVSAAVDRTLLDSLWYIAACGLLAAVAVAVTIREQRPEAAPGAPTPDALPFARRTLESLRVLVRLKPVLYLTAGIVVATFSGSAIDEAFDISLVTKGMDARALAPLGILDDVIGMLAPLASVALARRLGANRMLALFLILPAVCVCVLFVADSLWTVLALFIVLDIFDDLWDPVAETRLHALIPSEHRATIGSAVNQMGELARLLGLGGFGLLLGTHGEELRDLAPDLVEVFSGGAPATVTTAVPAPWLGLPLPDLAIVLFVISGLLAVPFLLRARAPRQRKKT